jgi:transketolase
MTNEKELQKLAKLVRKWCLISTTEAGSGHPTSCLSAADIATVLFDKYFAYDIADPLHFTNDRIVLSKGHAAPLLYTLFALSGGLELEALRSLRKFESPLEGHPTPNFNYTEAATGSLGQGLSVASGLAYFQKQAGFTSKSYVILGDGELAEGQNWEAANFASHYKLDNLIAIADINRLGQSEPTMFGHQVDEYMARFRAFGFEVIGIDGHDYQAIDSALQEAHNNTSGKPYIIISKTYKGYGVSFLKDNESMHGKTLSKDELAKALDELGDIDDSLRFTLKHPQTFTPKGEVHGEPDTSVQTEYKLGEEIATRDVYGNVLAKLGESNVSIYALDGDVKNSTFSLDFKKAYPDRFIECFIAEQNMVSVAVGLSRLRRMPFVSTFAAFLTRAADQIRLAALSHANVRFVGSHAGVSIGEDGASQMGLEDIALFGTLPGTTVLHPSDAVSASKLLGRMAETDGISYLRTLRPKTPVIYKNDEEFVIGGSKIVKKSDEDVLTIVASGITVYEAIKAADTLEKDGVFVRVIDCYSVKPIDKDALHEAVQETKHNILITVEDHFEHGGLGDFVLSAVSETGAIVHKMAVDHLSRSGKKEELLHDAGIDADCIVKKVKEVM